jgi:acyl-homoserine lactone acylase PvdQ
MSAENLRAAADVFAQPVKYFDSTIGKNPALWSWGLLTHGK